MSSGRKELSVSSWATNGELIWFEYKSGYLKAIHILMQQVMGDSKSHISDLKSKFGLVYPVTFLCRHYVEIELKEVIALGHLMGFSNGNKKFGHRLGLIWIDVMKCVEDAQGTDRRKEFENNVGPLIDFFERLDPSGDGFRYPKTTSGTAQWNKSFEIDVTELNDKIRLCAEYFDELLRNLKQMLDPDANDIDSRYCFY